MGASYLNKWKTRKIKSLERMIVEQGYDRLTSDGSLNSKVDSVEDAEANEDSDDSDSPARTTARGGGATAGLVNIAFPNYLSVQADPSIYPARHFCSICGYPGKYSCIRCGSKYCSIKCNKTHSETRCMKFGTSI